MNVPSVSPNKKVEFICIHINKTGGKSFRKVLKKQYGNGYYRINLKNSREVLKPAQLIKRQQIIENIPDHVIALHRHFLYIDVEPLVKSTGAKLIVWLRNPVDRLVSQYYFVRRKIIKDKKKEYRINMNPDVTLTDFANQKTKKNVISKILEGLNLSDIFFIGFLEYFKEDLNELGELLGWGKNIKLPYVNSNQEYKSLYHVPTIEEREIISEINAKDMKLFNEALRIKGKFDRSY